MRRAFGYNGPVVTPSTPPAAMSASSTTPRILVVDDEVGLRESLRMMLKVDFEVATAESGRRRSATCRASAPTS